MNAEKINKLAKDITEENKKLNVASLFTNVINSLTNIVNQPNQPGFQTELSNNLLALIRALDGSLVNNFSPAWAQMLIELKIDEFFGSKLSVKINEIINTNNITPATALQELNTIYGQYNKVVSGFSNVASGLSSLNVGFDELEDGECEIGVLIPRKYIDNNLENLGNEIREVNFIFNTFSELIDGQKKPFLLRNLSTSEPLITVATGVAVAAGIAKTIGFLIDNYKKLLEIKKLKNELKKQGISDENLKGIEDHSNNYMGQAIESVIKEIKAEYIGDSSSSRENELLAGIKISLNKIANRIDNGFNFEVRVNVKPTENAQEDLANDENIKVIQSASVDLQFIRSEGDSILSLPENK